MTPDYRFRTIEIARDALECLSCDGSVDKEQRVDIQRAITALNNVRFALYPLRKPLEVVK